MPDRPSRTSSRCLAAAVHGLALAALVALGQRPLAAQAAGVIEPPPRRVVAPPPPPVATGPTINASARRDSLTLRQRLDIQAWVDSAAGALAGGAPASTVPLPPMPPAPADTARRAPAPAPRRPFAGTASRPWTRTVGAAWTVAGAGPRW